MAVKGNRGSGALVGKASGFGKLLTRPFPAADHIVIGLGQRSLGVTEGFGCGKVGPVQCDDLGRRWF